MKTTGKASIYDEIEHNPSLPFLKDIKKDMDIIADHYSVLQANQIKKEMIQAILDTI